MFAQLGDIRFDLITYFDGLNASKKIDYAELKTIDGKPKLQYIGESLDTISIKLNFNKSFCTPEIELKKLKEIAIAYEPLSFVLGNGVYKGKYVIEEINETVAQTLNDGTLLSIDVEIKLKEYIIDQALNIKKNGKSKKQGKGKIKKKETKTDFQKGDITRQKIVRQG